MKRTMQAMTAIAVLLAAGGAAAAPYAMITDLKGAAWALEGGQAQPLALLGYIERPTEVKVDAASKIAVTYFADGVQYTVSGPARLMLEPGSAHVVDGPAADAKRVGPEKSIGGAGLSAEEWRRLQQATVVMRGVKASFSVIGPDRTTLLDRQAEFTWRPADGAKRYRFVLYGPGDTVLHETLVDKTSFSPGTSLALEPGHEYRWKVDALGVSHPVSASGRFRVADDAARSRMQELRRGAGNDAGPRAFYATTLEAEGYAYDARMEWRALAHDFPGQPQFAARAEPDQN